MSSAAVWDIVEVSGRLSESSDEPMGTKDKFWVEDADGTRWLFKYARTVDGATRNEDWAEWIVYQLAAAMELPTARIRPAVCAGRRGILSQSVLDNPSAQRLVHGNELLREASPDYDLEAGRQNPGYTLDAVRDVLLPVGAPHRDPRLAAFTGWDVFAGYLLLDAWVAGRDRHHENWAVIEDGKDRALAPSFDHGNALGFQVTDAQLQLLVGSPAVLERWASKGSSPHFAGKPSLVSLARDALARTSAGVPAYWTSRIQSVSDQFIREIVEAVPASIMSEDARTFVFSLLELNGRRLANEI